MLERFLQESPPPTDPAPPEIHIDLGGLADGIWQAFVSHLGEIGLLIWQGIQDHLGEIGTALWNALGAWLYTTMRNLMVALWHGTLLSIPHELTDRFVSVTAMMPPPWSIAAAGLAAAIVLLGLRTILNGLPGRAGPGPAIDELIGRIAKYAMALAILPWIISQAIEVQRNVARNEAIDGIFGSLQPGTGTAFVAIDPLMSIALVVMFFLGIRLWFKLASNIVHVAAAIVWSPVALVCGLFPQSEWVAQAWIHEFSGRLGGALLATIATMVGLGLAVSQGGLLAVAMGGGAFMAAYDLVDWLAKTPGSSVGGMVGMGMRAAGSVAGGGGAAAAAPISQRESLHLAEMYGFD